MSARALFVCLLAGVAITVACSKDPAVAREEFLAEGNRYMSDKKYTQAVVSYRNAVQQDERSGEARSKLSEAYLAAGDSPSALREALSAAELLPDDAEMQMRAGFLLLLAKQFGDARTRAAAALAKDPRNPRALVLLGNALAGLRDLDAAVEQIEEAINVDRDFTLGYANLGALEAARGDREAAEAALRRAVQIAPKSPLAHSALANYLLAAGNRDEARTELKAALALDPESAMVNKTLAMLHIAQNQLPEAEPYLRTYANSTGTIEARLLLADYYARTRKAADAVPILNEVEKEPRGSVPATLRLAALDFADGRRAEAHAQIEGILSRQKQNEQALAAKAELLLLEGKKQEALTVATTLVENSPKWARGHFVRGTVLESTGQIDDAINAFQDVLRTAPASTAAQVRLARLFMLRGRFAEALPLTQQLVKAQPRSAPVHLLYAQALVRTGDLTNAERELVSLAKFAPSSADVHAWLGLLYEARRDTARARRSFQTALDLQPDSDLALGGLVSVDLAENRAGAGLARVEAQLAKNPKDPGLLMISARTHLAMRDLPKAEAAYRRLLEVNPNDLDAYNRLGAIYVSQKRLDEARRAFEDMARYEKTPVVAETLIGTILVQQNRTTEARKHFERALQLDPRAAVAANNLAWDYANNGGNLDAALQLAQTAKAQLPENASVTDTLGWIYYKKGLNAVAVSTLREAAKQNPSSAAIQYHLGLALLQNGDKVAARATLEGVLKKSPAFPDAAEARRVLSTIKG